MFEKRFTAVIIDDELNAVKAMKSMIEHYCKQIEIIGEYTNSLDGLAFILGNKPDIIFLDIEMPLMNGFELVKKINGQNSRVIFTTAYNEYAINAIKVNALDYLLKPIHPSDLLEAVGKIEKVQESAQFSNRITSLLDYIEEQNDQITKLKVGIATNNIEENIKVWGLTNSEAEVAKLIIEGKSLQDISTLLFKAKSTIAKQTQSIYRKLGVNSKIGLINVWIK